MFAEKTFSFMSSHWTYARNQCRWIGWGQSCKSKETICLCSSYHCMKNMTYHKRYRLCREMLLEKETGEKIAHVSWDRKNYVIVILKLNVLISCTLLNLYSSKFLTCMHLKENYIIAYNIQIWNQELNCCIRGQKHKSLLYFLTSITY